MKSGSMPTQYFIRMAPLKMARVDRFMQKSEPIGESESVHCPLLNKCADSNQASWCVSEVINCHGIRKLPEVCVLFMYNNELGAKRQKRKAQIREIWAFSGLIYW